MNHVTDSTHNPQSISRQWTRSGEPWVWLNAGAVSISLILVLGLLLLIAYNGLGHFWPKNLFEIVIQNEEGTETIIGQVIETEKIATEIHAQEGAPVIEEQPGQRSLIKVANRDVFRPEFLWIEHKTMLQINTPDELLVIERREWGDLYGRLIAVTINQDNRIQGTSAYRGLIDRLQHTEALYERIEKLEKNDIGQINHQLETLRLQEKKLALEDRLDRQHQAVIEQKRAGLKSRYIKLQVMLEHLNQLWYEDFAEIQLSNGDIIKVPLAKIILVYRPNLMTGWQKIVHYFAQIGLFLTQDPREANTEGGVFPAIFGTIVMVILMSIMVTPLGVIAGIYLHEYARHSVMTRLIRIAVNNLAGVPSIVYGVFGLGFFVYFLGGSLDALFFPEAAPEPVFGTPGLLWASMTLALLTLPVVIVSTEEGLARIPTAIREGSLALGATRAETLIMTILPMASPAMMTGLILAVARAAGEVAPLMLVGVVKLAPSLPVDSYAPFIHLERKFMHLGFHIYDVGLQSPNIEAARPLVFATALLLVVIILVLNITAIMLRNNLREKYKDLEQ